MSLTEQLKLKAQQKAAEQLAAQNKNLATGMATTTNMVAAQQGEQQQEEQKQEQPEPVNAPVGGYLACAIKSLCTPDGKRFYPVDGYFIPENEAQYNECERWVALGMISPAVPAKAE